MKDDLLVHLDNVSKKYINEWIFRNLSYTFTSSNSYAIVGPNGSGKSTLLQALTNSVPVTSGKVSYESGNGIITPEDIYKYISLVSPALETVEEFTLKEAFEFHTKLKPSNMSDAKSFAEAIFLAKNLHKPVKNFSSGMKQRLKLGLAFYDTAPLLFLDEPTTNLDDAGIKWYQSKIEGQSQTKLVIVSSNQKHEYEFCNQTLNVVDFK